MIQGEGDVMLVILSYFEVAALFFFIGFKTGEKVK